MNHIYLYRHRSGTKKQFISTGSPVVMKLVYDKENAPIALGRFKYKKIKETPHPQP